MLNQPNYGHGHAYEAAHGHTQTHSGGAYTAAHYQQQQQQIHAQAQAQAQQQQQQQHFPIHTAAAAAAAAAAVASATAGSQYLAAGSGSAGNSHLHQNQQSALAQHLISAGNAGGYILQQQQQQHHQHLQHQQQQQHLLHQSYHSPPGGSMVAASHNHGAANHAAAVAAAAVMAASSAVPAAVQPPPPPPQEEITTIFVVGFPPDMQEREFQNMFIFSPGFEAATLKIPAKDEVDHAGHKKQIIGFAKFRTRLQALEARDILSGRKVDAEKGSVLKAEMAKKNLHTKRGLSNEFFHPAFQQYGILNMQLSAAAAAAAAANGGAGGPAHLAAAQTAAMAAAAVSGATAAAHAGSHGLPPLASGYLSSSPAGAAGSHLALPAPPGRDESFGDARNTRVPQGYGSSGMGGNAGSVSAAPPGVILYGTGATGVSPPALEHLFASSAVNSPGMTVLGGPGVGESSGIVELIDEQNSHSTASQAGTGGLHQQQQQQQQHQQQQQQQAAVHAHYAMEAAAAAAYAANAKQAGSGLPRPSSAASMASATSAATTAGGASGQMHKRFASPLPSPSASQTTFSGFVSDRRSNDRDPIMDELEQQFAVTSVCDTSSAGNETNMTVVDGIACAAAAASSENAVASPRPHRPASASPPSSSVPLTMPASSMPSAAASPLSSLPASPATSSTLFKPSSLVGSSPHGPSPLNPNTNGNAAAGTSPGNRPASPLASPASTTSSSGSLASFAVGTQPNANQVKPARISGLSINASLANRWTKGGLATTATASAAHMLSPATPVVNYDAPNYQAPPGNAVYLPGGVPAAVAADASQLLRQLPGFKRVLMAGDGVVLEFEEPKHAEEAKSWAVKALQGSVREDEILVVATNASSEVEQQQHYQQVMDLSRSATL